MTNDFFQSAGAGDVRTEVQCVKLALRYRFHRSYQRPFGAGTAAAMFASCSRFFEFEMFVHRLEWTLRRRPILLHAVAGVAGLGFHIWSVADVTFDSLPISFCLLADEIVTSDDRTSDLLSSSQTSTSLLRAAQQNDADAWRRLVELYSRRVYRWCRRRGLQPADAANVVQEVLRSVARKIGDFQYGHAGDSFRGWLRRITENKVLDFFRRSQREVAGTGGTDAHRRLLDVAAANDNSSYSMAFDNHDEEPTWVSVDRRSVVANEPDSGDSHRNRGASNASAGVDDRSLTGEKIAEVRAAVGERDWRVFWRVVVDGQTAAEAGCEFGMTANAVRLVKMKLLRRLRQQLLSKSSEAASGNILPDRK